MGFKKPNETNWEFFKRQLPHILITLSIPTIWVILNLWLGD